MPHWNLVQCSLEEGPTNSRIPPLERKKERKEETAGIAGFMGFRIAKCQVRPLYSTKVRIVLQRTSTKNDL